MTAARSKRERVRARRRVLQALYQWQLTGQDPAEIERQFLSDHRLGRVDLDYFSALLRGITAQAESLDAAYDGYLDRPARTLDPVELALLRLGTYELRECIEVPYRVCIDEAVELAKSFGAEQSHRFINGILDKVGRDFPLRQSELKTRQG